MLDLWTNFVKSDVIFTIHLVCLRFSFQVQNGFPISMHKSVENHYKSIFENTLINTGNFVSDSNTTNVVNFPLDLI